MTTIHTSAPGKLFLLGEYAVLEGAPALLTAVDRRVRVTLAQTNAAHWRLTAPGLGIDNLQLEHDGALPLGLDPATRRALELYDAVRHTVADAAGAGTRSHGHAHAGPAHSIIIDSGDLSMDGYKLGLGGSAAVAVALTAALTQAYAPNTPTTTGTSTDTSTDSEVDAALDTAAVFRLALAGHRLAQGARGSGGDVAAAVTGGLLSYRPQTSAAPPHFATSLRWPADLTLMVVVTGSGSSTPELVGRVAAFARADPHTYRSDLARLSQLSEQAVGALKTADSFLALASSYFDALVTLDAHAQAGIISDRHQQLHALAARHGGVFKSSGAGGGDVGLAFARSGEPARQLARALRNAHARIVPLTIGAEGVTSTVTTAGSPLLPARAVKDQL